MGFLDRLLGREPQQAAHPPAPRAAAPMTDDERAVERYRYLLRTAPPDTVEQVHAEAFSRLTEDQRRQVLTEVSAQLPPAEQPRSAAPQDLARAATRAEYTNPGFMERTLGPQRQGPGMGAMIGSSLLGTVAGYVIGSALVSTFMTPETGAADAGSEAGGEAADPGADGGADAGADAGGDVSADGGWDGGGDWGGGFDGGGFDGGGDFGF